MRRFRLDTVTENAGEFETKDCVALGCLFNDGTTVLRWLGENASTIVHTTYEAMAAVHHVVEIGTKAEPGQRRVRWEDPICFACGADTIPGRGGCMCCGATWDKPMFTTSPDPSQGKWVRAGTVGGDQKAAPVEP